MTKKKPEMRIKEVGATINLGNYSSLKVTVGESTEYEGLELQRATSYLKALADKMGGILNLPDEMVDGKNAKTAGALATPMGVKSYAYANGTPVNYEHTSHTYSTDDGKVLTSVTQFLGRYYPKNENIAKEYMDFAASFGNLVHTAIQNAIIGKAPKKELVKPIVDDVLKGIGEFDESAVEQIIVDTEWGLAGRFDILTTTNSLSTLWDVKTNSDLFMPIECTLPAELKEFLSEFWAPDTMYGEHCLQLNLYVAMLARAGVKVANEAKIIHVPDGFDQVYSIPIIDLTPVMEMLLDGQKGA